MAGHHVESSWRLQNVTILWWRGVEHKREFPANMYRFLGVGKKEQISRKHSAFITVSNVGLVIYTSPRRSSIILHRILWTGTRCWIFCIFAFRISLRFTRTVLRPQLGVSVSSPRDHSLWPWTTVGNCRHRRCQRSPETHPSIRSTDVFWWPRSSRTRKCL